MKNYSVNSWQILSALLSIALLTGLGAGFLTENRFSSEWWSSLLLNLSTELLGAVFTFVLIDILLSRSQKMSEVITILRAQLNSQDSQQILDALEKIKVEGLDDEGLLRNADWSGLTFQELKLPAADLRVVDLSNSLVREANFAGATLRAGNLENANLAGANLCNANLYRIQALNVCLEQAKLDGANLSRANLHGANLKHASLANCALPFADLGGAQLRGCTLNGANLRHANLQNADLTEVDFDERTILPDGNNWFSEIDLSIYTSPTHPLFYRSTHSYSPAFGYPARE